MSEGSGAPARVSYIFPETGTNELADQIRARRGGKELLDLDGILLHSPPIAQSWNAFGAAIRSKSTLSLDLVELLICRVAVLNGAAFVWREHSPIALQAGIPQATLHILRTAPAFSFSSTAAPAAASTTTTYDFPEVHAALLDYVDHMTKAVKVPSAVFARVKNAITSVSTTDPSQTGEAGEADKIVERKVVEVTTTIAGYNMVTRVVMALDVGGLESEEVPVPSVG
ncbi:uncharacterized protein STEHIDRAFT_154814 [Stereum hirsutum FP-91666 SS1]|uniref:uncharacterized protein n=1 Tax=Stereum hirsutum (strain FP-91666) TaxID=721885 RepID=UPI000440B912|nr:uncharacterized protein STEHIDRAFT_154814 [Stereum hirsutum FP-91666 SS1]EIM89130.1 hypothetical protein STEHIDRAFT_154814 [Stereum hirsutum FP-91666 SS1]